MPMPKDQIEAAIDDRLVKRWRERCQHESAAPVCVIAIKQLPGRDFGQPVVCTCEDMPDEQLAGLLAGVSRLLFRGNKSGTRRREERSW